MVAPVTSAGRDLEKGNEIGHFDRSLALSTCSLKTVKSDNPILNNPYEVPRLHYHTNLDGELDYSKEESGRRYFTGAVQSIPVPQRSQTELITLNDLGKTEYGTHLVNLLRKEVGAWRSQKYPNTTRVTRELLNFWFLNDERADNLKLFFAQQEAIETAIFLNEVAEKSNPGQNILRLLQDGQTISSSAESNLPRVAFKMATGTGKTVVMAALIVYHYFNRVEYRNDTRFADCFLVITPGVTIKNRLSVLEVDPRTGADALDYYYARWLVPSSWRRELLQINARLVITNFHAFEPKTLQGNKRSPFDGKLDTSGKKQEAREEFSQVVRRLLRNLKAGSRLLVINDEAHHCYLPKEDDRTAEGENTEEENKRAAVWFTGLREIAQRFKIRHIYDLSATPYFLTGSGYEPYTLFPWVVSDFGLIEAIESGLVKIPFLPTSDDTQELKEPVLKNLYEHVKEKLPRAGQKRQRKAAKEKGEVVREAAPRLPDIVKAALAQFEKHYEEEFHRREHSVGARGDQQLEMTDTPPVFIIVCNNTSVSKEVFKYVAGYELTPDAEGDKGEVVSGVFDLLSNFDPSTLRPRRKPPTLLIDSDALENSGQIDADFKQVFASEITNFKRDYARIHGQGAAENIEDAEILREVVNSVGKPNSLGAHIRCVISVSMLTEGWDANTVTHIMGLRAFGSQLLCEQVAGRALRRKAYFLRGYDKEGNPIDDKRRIAVRKFPPEYAHIIGVPFKLFKGGSTKAVEPPVYTRVFALKEREQFEITFPNVEGYRIEYPDGPLNQDFLELDDYVIDGSTLPTQTVMSTAMSAETQNLSVADVLERREQEIIYLITKDLLRNHFSTDKGAPEFQKFHELKAIVTEWYHTKVRVLGKDPKWKKLIYFHDPKPMVDHVARGIFLGTSPEERIRPVLNYYNPTGSSRHVNGNTTKETYPATSSHVNVIVIDSGWEGKAAKALDLMAGDGEIEFWVKNNFLGFEIPYVDKDGVERNYMPDFIVRCTTPTNGHINLIVEISGMRFDKTAKRWFVEHRWLPAVNSVGAKHDWGRWDFLELDSEQAVADLRDKVLGKLKQPFKSPLAEAVIA
jgi:type III restriction enzyme